MDPSSGTDAVVVGSRRELIVQCDCKSRIMASRQFGVCERRVLAGTEAREMVLFRSQGHEETLDARI
jgi:hypothetical protein